jgi:hypothetical protein
MVNKMGVKWTELVARMAEMRNVYIVLVEDFITAWET